MKIFNVETKRTKKRQGNWRTSVRKRARITAVKKRSAEAFASGESLDKFQRHKVDKIVDVQRNKSGNKRGWLEALLRWVGTDSHGNGWPDSWQRVREPDGSSSLSVPLQEEARALEQVKYKKAKTSAALSSLTTSIGPVQPNGKPNLERRWEERWGGVLRRTQTAQTQYNPEILT